MAQSLGSSRDIPEFLNTPYVDWETRHRKTDREDEAVRSFLADSIEESLIELTLASVRATRKAAFDKRGLSLTPDDFIDQAKDFLAKNGVLEVLDNSLALVLDAAAITICTSARIDPNAALPSWEWSHRTPLLTARHINDCFRQSLGFAPLLIHKEEVVFSMI